MPCNMLSNREFKTSECTRIGKCSARSMAWVTYNVFLKLVYISCLKLAYVFQYQFDCSNVNLFFGQILHFLFPSFWTKIFIFIWYSVCWQLIYSFYLAKLKFYYFSIFHNWLKNFIHIPYVLKIFSENNCEIIVNGN